jgi:preprotein translocase subunit SecB
VSQCPLAIKEYYITNVSVRANPQATPGVGAQVNVQAKAFSARNADNKKLWRVGLEVTCTPIPGNITPYFIQVESVGFFEVSDSVPVDKVEGIVANWGPAMLYGAIRELVVLITSRGPNPGVVLPSFSFTKENALPDDTQTSVAANRLSSGITVEA